MQNKIIALSPLRVFLEEGTSNELGSLRTSGVNWEVHNPVVLHAAAEAWEEFLQAWSDVDVHSHQFRLVIIPDWDEVHTLGAASADITNEVEVSVSSILDIVTSIAQLASRVSGFTVVSSVAIFTEVMNIETWTTATATEAWNAAELGVGVDSLTIGTGEGPLVGAAALGFGDGVESLLTDFVTLFHID